MIISWISLVIYFVVTGLVINGKILIDNPNIIGNMQIAVGVVIVVELVLTRVVSRFRRKSE
jgi:hypothetical protein